MSHTQHLDRSQIEQDQLAKLRALLGELLPSNAFYGNKLKSAGLDGDVSSLQDFSDRMPFTTKSDLTSDHRANAPYGTNLTYPLEQYTRFSQTSATTGKPLRWLDTPESWAWMLDNWDRVYESAGVTKNDTIFFAFSFGPFLGFWTAYESALRFDALCIPGGGFTSTQRLGIIVECGATVLCCTPTYAIRLGEVAKEEGIDLTQSKIRTIIVAGEPGANVPTTRARMMGLWNNARIVDHHGMTEVGPVSYECPERPGILHVIESSYIAEVVDPDTGQPMAPGESGELVLTTLGRTGSPLLRYRTGDVVRPELPGRCQCGRCDLALKGGIIGRTDDMIIVRGVNVFPSALEELIAECDEVTEYRIEVRSDHTMVQLNIVIEPTPLCESPIKLSKMVKKKLQEAFPIRIEISTVPPGSLPRFEMKSKRWVREDHEI